MPSSPRSWSPSYEPAAVRQPQGILGHVPADLQEADHPAIPGVQAPRIPALPRTAPPLAPREWPREVRWLLALRSGFPRRLHPGRRRREHSGQPRLAGRALCAHLRDQPLALHLLRLLRACLPLRRDHARGRVRALRVLPRRPHLHEGHAARAAGQARAGRRPRTLRHADPCLEGGLLVPHPAITHACFSPAITRRAATSSVTPVIPFITAAPCVLGPLGARD